MDPLLHVDAVELLPEVIAASAYFTRAEDLRAASSQLQVTSADARRFIRTAETFRVAFPRGLAMLATNTLETPVIGLVAVNDSSKLDSRLLSARLRHAVPLNPQFALDDDLALGSFIAGPSALARFAGTAPLNTDDHPVVAYLAPQITYVRTSSPNERLLALLNEVSIAPGRCAAQNRRFATSSALTAYWSARDRYLEVDQHVHPTNDVRRMLAQVREPLLSVLRISPDFRPAYDPLLRMAVGLAEVDRSDARALLTDLQRVQPARVEAGELLRELAEQSNGS